jgi:ribosomal-protein-alanine N-acetyltransferase
MIDSPSPSLKQIRMEAGTHRDLDAVVAIMDAAFDDRFGEGWTRSQCAGILPMPGVTITLARSEAGEPVGFALQRIIAGEGELLLLAVDPKARRRGIGWKLLQRFIEEARDAGSSRVHLEVRDGNPAVVMYRTAGFKAVGRRRKYYHGRTGGQFDALTLALDL